MNLQDRRISDSVTRCNQMETELRTLQGRQQGSEMHLLKTKGPKGKVFWGVLLLVSFAQRSSCKLNKLQTWLSCA